MKVVRNCKHGSTKRKTCLSSQDIYKEISGLLDERKAEDMVYPDFSKAFSAVLHKFFKKNLMRAGLNEQTVGWTET